MARKSLIEKNKRNKLVCQNNQKKKADFVRKKLDSQSTKELFEIHLEYQRKIPRSASIVRIRNRCLWTGRPRGVYRNFGACRHEMRRLIHRGFCPGIRKSSC